MFKCSTAFDILHCVSFSDTRHRGIHFIWEWGVGSGNILSERSKFFALTFICIYIKDGIISFFEIAFFDVSKYFIRISIKGWKPCFEINIF